MKRKESTHSLIPETSSGKRVHTIHQYPHHNSLSLTVSFKPHKRHKSATIAPRINHQHPTAPPFVLINQQYPTQALTPKLFAGASKHLAQDRFPPRSTTKLPNYLPTQSHSQSYKRFQPRRRSGPEIPHTDYRTTSKKRRNSEGRCWQLRSQLNSDKEVGKETVKDL